MNTKWMLIIIRMQISTEEINFRLWYDFLSELEEAENKDEFPPRFKIKLNCYTPLDPNTLDLRYKICIKKIGEEDRYLSLNVFISHDNRSLPKGLKFDILPS